MTTSRNLSIWGEYSGTVDVPVANVPNIGEVATVSATAADTTVTYNAITQSLLYYTSNATANWAINIRGSASVTMNNFMSTGQSVTVAFLATNGASAKYCTSVQIDGTTSGVTTKWQGGSAPSAGNASAVDAYAFTIVKTGSSTYTVFASQTKFA